MSSSNSRGSNRVCASWVREAENHIIDEGKKEVQKMLEPIMASWPTSGVSIVSDGWKDPTRHPIINFMVSSTRFAYSFMMLKRLREVKTALGSMVIFEFWYFWRKTDHAASKRVKDRVLDDAWWERVDLIIRIMDPIISLHRVADTDKPILGEVYEGWDSMIEFVRSIILQSECPEYETSTEAFCDTIHDILVSR